jgi:BASS family bile acid:Na+ symporter
MTPFSFAFWGGLYTRYLNRYADAALQPLHIDIWQTLETVFILLGIPLVLGILFVHFFPKTAEKMKKPMQYFSLIFFIAMVVLSFSNNFDLFIKYIFFIFIIVFLHNALALGIGYGVGSAFRIPRKDRRTLTIETGIKIRDWDWCFYSIQRYFPLSLPWEACCLLRPGGGCGILFQDSVCLPV